MHHIVLGCLPHLFSFSFSWEDLRKPVPRHIGVLHTMLPLRMKCHSTLQEHCTACFMTIDIISHLPKDCSVQVVWRIVIQHAMHPAKSLFPRACSPHTLGWQALWRIVIEIDRARWNQAVWTTAIFVAIYLCWVLKRNTYKHQWRYPVNEQRKSKFWVQ